MGRTRWIVAGRGINLNLAAAESHVTRSLFLIMREESFSVFVFFFFFVYLIIPDEFFIPKWIYHEQFNKFTRQNAKLNMSYDAIPQNIYN